ncbi:MAG: phage tail sheath C-terminal domain-containing protein [Bacteroidota bacterium]
MSTTMKTPGVYIQELDAFGNAVVPIPTAVPAFIGYTAQTSYNGQSLLNKAVKVTSLTEFLTIFGGTPPQVQYTITSSILPDRIDALQAVVTATQKTLDAANAAVKAAQSKATPEQNDAVKAATTANTAAKTALTTAQADPNIKALDAAQKALTANTDVTKTSDLEAAVKKAQATIDTLVNNASFVTGGYAYNIATSTINYRLYSGIKFFYENGGGECYIMSIGAYDYSKSSITDTTDFMNAITLLQKETEPTMLVIPDVVEIADPTADPTSETYLQDKYANAYSLQSDMINNCGELQSRIAILDIPGGYSEPLVGTTSVEQFRNSVEPIEAKSNSYAAAYYPWLHTTVYQTSEIGFANVNSKSYEQVTQLLNVEFTSSAGVIDPKVAKIISAFSASPETSLEKADQILQNLSKSYQLLMGAIMGNMNLLAPSAGMAGIYTSVDNSEGVWVAPANVGIQSTVSPSIKVDNDAQEDLNVPLDGKSICVIRSFTGRGNLVWGARTLDGNSNDWRYVNVRRTLMFIEQSVKDAAQAYVFAPNDASTWITVQSMISNFLTSLWNQGGLVGPKASDAFSVSVGLGSTMTAEDILLGIMRVAVKVAVSHPAEFIEITFQQEMQKA